MTKGNLSVGIDFGTTYSRIGIWKSTGVEIIENEYGKRMTPSYVSFNDVERLFGEMALNKIEVNPKNTIYNTKRIIGRYFNDEKVQSELKHLPFEVVEKNKRPYIKVEYKKEIKEFTVEEISSMILSEMKKKAENYLGQSITDAVITVPSHFNNTQRTATLDACKIAGINVLSIINEPIAAALTYCYNNRITNLENVLVVDIGGGTYDVCLLSINNGIFDVKAISGDAHLGGENFTNRLIKYCVDEIKEKYGKDVTIDPNSKTILSRLRRACENVKCKLHSIKEESIEIINLFDGIYYETNITRSCFEKLSSDLFERILPPIERVIEDSKIQKSDISEIILVGGSTRILKIKEIISSYFGKKLTKTINPDEAVIYGATIQSSILSVLIPNSIIIYPILYLIR